MLKTNNSIANILKISVFFLVVHSFTFEKLPNKIHKFLNVYMEKVVFFKITDYKTFFFWGDQNLDSSYTPTARH